MTAADQGSVGGSRPLSGNVELVFYADRALTGAVQQVSVSADNIGGSASCAVYRENVAISPLVPEGRCAAGDPPVPVRLGQRLRVAWVGCTPGGVVRAIIIMG